MAATRKDMNRNIRKEALREQLKNKGLVQQVLVISEKLYKQYESLEASQINALKSSAELKLKLVNKYLPDLKATEITGKDGEPIEIDMAWTVEVVEPSEEDNA